MNRRVLYPAGMFVIILICIALALLSLRFTSPLFPLSDHGIAFPSPEVFPILPGWGATLNIILLFAGGIALYFLNKNFSLLRTGQPLGASFLLPLCFATLPLPQHLSSAPILLLVVIATLSILIDSFRSANSTRRMFVAATFLSVGSMFQIAFIPLIIATFICAFVMETVRFKEIIAYGLGLIAPYWVGIGFGIINPLSLRFPFYFTLMNGNIPTPVFITLVAAGIFALTAAILSIYNGIILYAGNSRVRRSIITINIFGITALIAGIADTSNIAAYLGIFYIWIATQFANLFSLRNMRRGMLSFWLIQAVIYSLAVCYTLL